MKRVHVIRKPVDHGLVRQSLQIYSKVRFRLVKVLSRQRTTDLFSLRCVITYDQLTNEKARSDFSNDLILCREDFRLHDDLGAFRFDRLKVDDFLAHFVGFIWLDLSRKSHVFLTVNEHHRVKRWKPRKLRQVDSVRKDERHQWKSLKLGVFLISKPDVVLLLGRALLLKANTKSVK